MTSRSSDPGLIQLSKLLPWRNFASKRGYKTVTRIGQQSLKEWNVTESKQVLEWMAQGEDKGRREGEARGETRGVIRLLEKRFSGLPTDLVKAIQTGEDLLRIRSWFDLALQTASLEEFRQQTGL